MDFIERLERHKLGNKADSIYERAKDKYKTGDIKGALIEITESIKILDDVPEYHTFRGSVNYALDNYFDAVSNYTKSIELEPNQNNTYYLLALACSEIGDYERAIDNFNITIKLNPKKAEAYYLRGVCKAELSNHVSAVPDFTMALELQPIISRLSKSPNLKFDIYYYRGYSKTILGDKRGAIEDFNNSIKHYKYHAQSYYQRGILRIALGENKSGCLDLSRAGELGFADAYKAINELCD